MASQQQYGIGEAPSALLYWLTPFQPWSCEDQGVCGRTMWRWAIVNTMNEHHNIAHQYTSIRRKKRCNYCVVTNIMNGFTWTIVSYPTNWNIIKTKFIYKLKDSYTQMHIIKLISYYSRLHSITWWRFSPVLKLISIHLFSSWQIPS